jgi:hypothetical protein
LKRAGHGGSQGRKSAPDDSVNEIIAKIEMRKFQNLIKNRLQRKNNLVNMDITRIYPLNKIAIEHEEHEKKNSTEVLPEGSKAVLDRARFLEQRIIQLQTRAGSYSGTSKNATRRSKNKMKAPPGADSQSLADSAAGNAMRGSLGFFNVSGAAKTSVPGERNSELEGSREFLKASSSRMSTGVMITKRRGGQPLNSGQAQIDSSQEEINNLKQLRAAIETSHALQRHMLQIKYAQVDDKPGEESPALDY